VGGRGGRVHLLVLFGYCNLGKFYIRESDVRVRSMCLQHRSPNETAHKTRLGGQKSGVYFRHLGLHRSPQEFINIYVYIYIYIYALDLKGFFKSWTCKSQKENVEKGLFEA